MNERDFQAGGRDFKLSKIDPFKQFHIVRRLGPIIGDLFPTFKKIQATLKPEMSEEAKFEVIAEVAGPVLSGLAKLSEEDANKVLLGLLEAVEVKQQPAGNWARVSKDGLLMMQDMDLPTMMQVAGRAFAYNLTGFFATAHQTSHGAR